MSTSQRRVTTRMGGVYVACVRRQRVGRKQRPPPPREPVMPFANLRDGDWRRRNHGIAGASTDLSATPTSKVPGEPGLPAPLPPPRRGNVRPATTGESHSQRVTAKDIEAGQVRIPRGATKAVLPSQRIDIAVVLRGRQLGACRWDPRYGPPERSGVIRVGSCRRATRRWRRAGCNGGSRRCGRPRLRTRWGSGSAARS